MLSPKPWKLEAIMRLLLKLFICMCAGWLVLAVLYSSPPPDHGRLKLILLAAAAGVFLCAALVLLRKPWTAENFLTRGVISLLAFYAGLILTAWAQHAAGPVPKGSPVAQTVVAMLSFQGAILVLTTFLLNQYGSSWREGFGLSKNTVRAVFIGLMVACFFLPIGYLLQWLSVKAMEHFTQTKTGPQEVVQTIQGAEWWLQRTLLGIFTIVLAPLGEETLFRGLLYSTIRQVGFPKAALWVTSIAFAAIHMQQLNDWARFVPFLALAICLAVLYEKTDNLLAPITAHSVFNTYGFVGIFLHHDRI